MRAIAGMTPAAAMVLDEKPNSRSGPTSGMAPMTIVEHDEWQTYWESQSSKSDSDFEFDRGTNRRSEELERLSADELLEFIDPQPRDEVLDAGCGTGANIAL